MSVCACERACACVRVVCVCACAASPYLFFNLCRCADLNQVLKWSRGASNGPPSTLNAYAKARDFFQQCCLNDDNVPSIIADRKQRARGEKCRRYFISMTLDGELTLLKDRQADTGQKEILLEHLEHLVISSLAVVFINLGVQVPRDLLKQFETKKDCTPDIVENRLVELKRAFVKQGKDVNLPIFRTGDDSLTALRIRNQRWRTVYEDRLKKLPMNFKGRKCVHLGDGVRYPTPAEFERACQDKEIPLV
jgi:hypothetical protein